MTGRAAPRLFSVPPGAPFLSTLADSLLAGELVPGFSHDGDPLALADVTIYVPTRRAARALRSTFVNRLDRGSAILPVIRPLGDFDEAADLFDIDGPAALDLASPIPALDRLLALAPLVRAWKRRLPAHVAALFEEDVVVPASTADAIWLARDLAALMDEVETEDADWTALASLVKGDLAAWWQVTLDFLAIVTEAWPAVLAERDCSNPAAHRSAMIAAEAIRLQRNPPPGPVVAAGSTGSIPATARLLSVVARLPLGAVVLPGLDVGLDEPSWQAIGESRSPASAFGHPQFGLKKLLSVIGALRGDVAEIGRRSHALAARAAIVCEALRPAETTDAWVAAGVRIDAALEAGALADVALIEAANEREEALAVAIALRAALEEQPAAHVALVTGDRELARRVAAELLRFGIRADDSGGTPLSRTPSGSFLTALLAAAFSTGDPLPILALMKHPLFRLGRGRAETRHLVELVELVFLRGGSGRPDAATLAADFERRWAEIAAAPRKPFWLPRLTAADMAAARSLLRDLDAALAPLLARRQKGEVDIAALARDTVAVLEALARDAAGSIEALYGGDAGENLADFLRGLLASEASLAFAAMEWPDVMAALMSGETVKPSVVSDSRVSIWGALEARLQSVDMLVIGGLNEGTWPASAQADRFMSRIMKTGMELEPPERRIGLAAHDFMMACGSPQLILSRALRQGDAPSVASRWLQRILAVVGEPAAAGLHDRGKRFLEWARDIDTGPDIDFVPRPEPKPPLASRPKRFSVTEVETLRRDPYAVYARRILRLAPLDPLVSDPGAAERGTLFHDILHRFTESGVDARDRQALEALIAIGRACFGQAALPPDVEAVWWPRFAAMAPHIIAFERARVDHLRSRHAEVAASPLPIGATDAVISGRADRIDILHDGHADILDYKTGSSPSRRQAHTLVAPQLALEGAVLKRGGFATLGAADPADLVYVRLRPNGEVLVDSILEFKRKRRPAGELSDDAWRRLEQLVAHYSDPEAGYLSRALPFREGDTDGDYDHLARVLEWSAGAEDDAEGEP